MKLRPLLRNEVHQAVFQLARDSRGLDIITYGFGKGEQAGHLLRLASPCRLLVGVFSLDEITRARAYYSWLRTISTCNLAMRVIKGSHCKMFLNRERRPTVIVGSMNLGGGATYESAVEITGKAAVTFAVFFERLWTHESIEISPLDLKEAAEMLSSAVFTAEGVSR